MTRRARCAAALVCAALGGCSVLPAYHAPQAPEVSGYTAGAPVSAIAPASAAHGSLAGAQTLLPGLAVDPRWWDAFQSPELTRLIERALAHNPDLAAAQATLEQAQANLRAARGTLLPQVGVGAGAERTRSSGASSGGAVGPQSYNLYTGQVTVGFDPDVFGAGRALINAGTAQIDVARAALHAAHLALAGSVAATVFQLAALDAGIAATEHNLADQRRILDLLGTRERLGAITQVAVLTQQSQVASTEAALAQLQQARDAARHLLATYLGAYPAELGTPAAPRLAEFTLPAELPLTLPSQLVRTRPDIRAAEARLRAANAEVAVAVARLYPSVQLGASLGGQSNRLGDLLDPASRIWDLAFNLAAPVFQGGTLRAQRDAARAAYRAVFANYRKTVLDAFRQVADTLRALQHDARVLDAQARAARDAERALALAQAQYRSGAVDFLDLLTSEVQVQTARVALANAQAQRLADTAALYVALGGGEWEGAVAPAAAAGTPSKN